MTRSASPLPTRRMARLAWPLLLAAPLLGACAPELATAPEMTPASQYDSPASLRAERGDWPKADWWKGYGDATLDALIEEALEGAPDIRIADARLQAALAAADATGALRNPDVRAGGEVTAVRQSLNMGFPDEFKPFLPHGWQDKGRIYVQAGYDLDLFGRNKALIKAADARAEAARAGIEAARLTLSTAIAMNYAELVRLSVERAMAADAVRLRRESTDLVARRVDAGLDHEGAGADARAALAAARATEKTIEGRIALVRNAIAALLGEGPDRGLAIALPAAPSLPALALPDDLPANLVARRPDIARARFEAEAEAAHVKAATADFYPNVNLTGLIGLESLGVEDLVKGNSLMGSFGPSISLPLFARDRLEGNLRGAEASFAAAVATYDKTVTGAFREVADSLAAERALVAEAADARTARTHATKAWEIARARYEGGLSRFTDVLSAEDRLLTARRQVADLEARVFAQHVALVRALGGGYEIPVSLQMNETEND